MPQAGYVVLKHDLALAYTLYIATVDGLYDNRLIPATVLYLGSRQY